ncbi:MAG: DUF2934 domain-containing protein [Kiritimatiellaeota bacterium]|nr:DUF2934 domain-containing protein [Kiritimatiellota bacterium]
MASKNKKTVAKKTSPPRPAKTAAPIQRQAAEACSSCRVTPTQRQRMIETAAYYLAEKNGFAGEAGQYWIQAEKDVDAKLGLKN